MTYLLRLLIFLTALPLAAPSFGVQPVTFTDAWVREGPPVARVLAGYVEVQNTGSADVTIVAVDSPACERIEMHNTVLEEGVARMVHQRKLIVPAGQKVSFVPGGYHLMLMGIHKPLRAGDTVALTFRLSDQTSVSIDATVRKAAGMTDNHQHHHH